MISQISKVYDPFGIVPPKFIEGKGLYREAYDERRGRNPELSQHLVTNYLKWAEQLGNVRVARSYVE